MIAILSASQVLAVEYFVSMLRLKMTGNFEAGKVEDYFMLILATGLFLSMYCASIILPEKLLKVGKGPCAELTVMDRVVLISGLLAGAILCGLYIALNPVLPPH
jgi:hypothetical protein